MSEPMLLDPCVQLCWAPQTVGAGKHQLQVGPLTCDVGENLQRQCGKSSIEHGASHEQEGRSHPDRLEMLLWICHLDVASDPDGDHTEPPRIDAVRGLELGRDMAALGEHSLCDAGCATGQQTAAPQLAPAEIFRKALERKVVDRDDRRHPDAERNRVRRREQQIQPLSP